MSVMIERLEGMVNRYHEITDLMMMPEVASDSRQLAKLGREQAELTQVVETYTEYRKTSEALEEAKTLLHEEDKEMREMARMEIEELEPKQEELLQKCSSSPKTLTIRSIRFWKCAARPAATKATSLPEICSACIPNTPSPEDGAWRRSRWMRAMPADSPWYPARSAETACMAG